MPRINNNQANPNFLLHRFFTTTIYAQIARLTERLVLRKNFTLRCTGLRVVKGAVESPKPTHTRGWMAVLQTADAGPICFMSSHIDERMKVCGPPLSDKDAYIRKDHGGLLREGQKWQDRRTFYLYQNPHFLQARWFDRNCGAEDKTNGG